ncbi:MAG: MoxR family ATPase [Bifidobacteriaceae bacterium]|jgi:MoxR-like ATPase|nr:MoxR family ATPase [Bifidobacteriaceae bacterium]
MNTELSPAELERARAITDRLSQAYAARVVGQDGLRWSLLIGLMAGGHVLIESVPGLAKTTAARTLAGAVNGSFHRIQCTPDLLPSDIVGTQVYDAAKATFRTEIGPIDANFVLMDEINRANAKTQSAMLEAMQERQVTIAGEIHKLPDPFIVLATQNPIEQEGTYELPEAQLDRFLLKEVLTYPDLAQEIQIMDQVEGGDYGNPDDLNTGVNPGHIIELQGYARRVYVDRAVKDYIARIVYATRHTTQILGPGLGRYVEYGASPRASLAFLTAGRALALMVGRGYVVPDDVAFLAHTVLRHRLILTYEAVADNIKPEAVIDAVFSATRTP